MFGSSAVHPAVHNIRATTAIMTTDGVVVVGK
jgi:hypothetical protein